MDVKNFVKDQEKYMKLIINDHWFCNHVYQIDLQINI